MSSLPECVTDFYHGVSVADPYRWLEESSAETNHWLEQKRTQLDAYFGRPELQQLAATLEPSVRAHLSRTVTLGPIIVRDGVAFYLRRLESEQQPSIVMRRGTDPTEEALVRPLQDAIGNYHSLELIDVSANCKWLAYGERVGGSSLMSVRIFDLEMMTLHPWSLAPGHLRSFVFEKHYGARYIHEDPAGARPHLRREIRQRLLDDDDQKISYVAGESKTLRFLSHHSPDLTIGIYRLIRLNGPKRETVMLFDRRECGAPMALVADDADFDMQFQVYTNDVFVCTNYLAPNKRICRLSLQNPSFDELEPLIAETGERIQWWRVSGDRVYVTYVRDLVNVTEIFDLKGSPLGRAQYPVVGTADLVGRNEATSSIFVQVESYDVPPTIYEVRPDGSCSLFSEPEQRTMGTLIVKRSHATADDGTSIPYTVLSKASASHGSEMSTILTAYGGNAISLTPRYSPLAHVWTEMGGVFAIANIRGGSEFGNAWHEAAKARKREVAFNDFRAVMEDLFRNGITTEQKLGIAGGSNSGTLVTHAMTEWPKSIRAVLCLAPFTDLLRFHREKPQYAKELGTIDDPHDFDFLHRISPYHRALSGGESPALLMVSGAKDDICAPYHALKFVAALQQVPQRNPVLLDFDPMRGHVPCLPLEVRINALVKRLVFMMHELKLVPDPEEKGGKPYDLHKASSTV